MMTEDEAATIFRELAALLQKHDLQWVVTETLDQVRLGRTSRESISIEPFESSAELSLPEAAHATKRRARKELLTKTVPYSKVERLGLLLDGIERATIHPLEMESDTIAFFENYGRSL
jgi:hypothetical protein